MSLLQHNVSVFLSPALNSNTEDWFNLQTTVYKR